MWFILEIYLRLEAFIKDCEQYSPTPVSRFMVMCCYIPFYTYIFFGIQYRYRNTLYYFFLWNSLFLNGGVLILFGLALPEIKNTNATCASRDSDRPCEESAIVCCVASYILQVHLYHLQNAYNDFVLAAKMRNKVKKSLVIISVYIFLTFASLVYLGLYNWEEVMVGAIIGSMCGLFTSFIYTYLLSKKLEHQLFQKIITIFYLEVDPVN